MKLPCWSILLVQLTLINSRKVENVTCGSLMKLINVEYKVRLHSHDVRYGTGSGQQSVTATQRQEDVNSHWLVKGPTKKPCPRGTPIKCGSIIRLTHLATSKNLHSHYFTSPLSENQEVSAYGNDGEGDSGDHWTVICDSTYWEREDDVLLKHVDTDMFLSVSGRQYSSPVNGQLEVVAMPRKTACQWKAIEGVYVHPTDFNPKASSHEHAHSEL